jgi:spore coat polysaccharide biosynthesis protein SpsF
MKVICIIQARMGSERLPGKVLMDIAGKPMLEHVITRLRQAQRIDEIIVATSLKPADDSITRFCEEKGVAVYRGSELDVLDRYYQAASLYQPDIVIRVTADCPLVDFEGIDVLINELQENALDYVAYDSLRIPRGLTGEVFTFDLLKRTYQNADQPYEREHVTIYMYEHPEDFIIRSAEPPHWLKRPEFRLTVDTPEDLKLIRNIYESESLKNNTILDIKEVICLLDQKPELSRLNRNICQKDPRK